MIHELESLLPASSTGNFRERLVARLEDCAESRSPDNLRFRQKARLLLDFYSQQFDVKDIFDELEDP